MKNYSKVAVASTGLFIGILMCETGVAQVRSTNPQFRPAPTRSNQTRSIQYRRPTQILVPSTRSIAPRTTRNAQPTSTRSRTTVAAKPAVDDKIPEAALLTQRGTELVARLKSLRYAESQMGSKHPSLGDVREQIASVKDELQAWVPVVKTKAAGEDDKVQTAETALAELNEEDLRQLVVRLALDVYKLRNRVVELESEQKKISSLVVERK